MSNPPFCQLGRRFYYNPGPLYVNALGSASLVPNATANGDNPYLFYFNIAYVDTRAYLVSPLAHSFSNQAGPFFRFIRTTGNNPANLMGIEAGGWPPPVGNNLWGNGSVDSSQSAFCSAEYNGIYTTLIMDSPLLGRISYVHSLNPIPYGGYHEDFTIRPHFGSTLTNIVFVGSNWGAYGSPCQGEIPSSHRVAVSSTAKISHNRILKEHRTGTEAQRFHDWMKNAT